MRSDSKLLAHLQIFLDAHESLIRQAKAGAWKEANRIAARIIRAEIKRLKTVKTKRPSQTAKTIKMKFNP
jgi:hypothetical protein